MNDIGLEMNLDTLLRKLIEGLKKKYLVVLALQHKIGKYKFQYFLAIF